MKVVKKNSDHDEAMSGTLCKCHKNEPYKICSSSCRYRRQLSLTEVERVVLSSLLVDTQTNLSGSPRPAATATTASKQSSFISSSSSLTNEMLFTHPFLFDLEQRDTVDTIPYKEKDKYHIVASASSLSILSSTAGDDLEDHQQDPDVGSTENNLSETTTEDENDIREPTTEKKTIERRKMPLTKPPRISLSRRPDPLGKTKRTKTTRTQIQPLPLIENNNVEETQSSKLPSSQSSSKKPGLLSFRPKLVQRSHTAGPGTTTSKKTNSIMNEMKNKPNPKNQSELWAAHDEGRLTSIHKGNKQGIANRSSNDSSMSDDNTDNLYTNNMKLREEMMNQSKDQTKIDDKIEINSGIFGMFANAAKETKKTNEADCILQREIPFDCWQILKDEYATEYGFGAKEEFAGTLDLNKISASVDSRDTNNASLLDSDIDDDDEDDTSIRQFKILGTGPDDLSAQPHVLSPPLMDSLLNFVPESLSFENLWLKYSLVRDGSCLETFRQYTRASRNTILAIQTIDGDVFGSFTTSPWENQGQNCFGNGESFVWKMRMNRSKISNQSSLYTQAHFESEIDVYPYSGVNSTVQHCSQNMIAIGGTEIETFSPLGFSYQPYLSDSSSTPPRHEKFNKDMFDYKKTEAGFAIALHDDLCRGTTSPCPTFCSPSLLSAGGEIFEVENLECWTFTPVDTVNEAQKLEMRKYFVARNTSRNSSSGSKSSQKQEFTSRDLVQGEFYRRLGDK